MRLKPLVGQKPWFGPHLLGWGLGPVSWQGWAVTIVTVAVAVKAPSLFPGATGSVVKFGALAALIVCCMLKGTSPGGPAARRQLSTHNMAHALSSRR